MNRLLQIPVLMTLIVLQSLPLTLGCGSNIDSDGDGYTIAVDCNDADASVCPGAPDVAGDGVDTSCDGSDGLAPSVVLPTSTFTTLQAALDAAKEGQTVWVGPGTYREYGLSMKGKALRLASTEGETTTIIDGWGLGTVFYFNEGETEESVLQGLTLKGGKASCNAPSGATSCYSLGGGTFMDNASPTLTHVTFTGNEALENDSGSGGGMYLNESSPTLEHCILAYNQASYLGGNLYRYTYESTPSTVTAPYSLIYNPSGWKADDTTPSGSYLTVEPKFLAYTDRTTGNSCTPGTSTTCLPADLHPALDSPLINAGDPAQQDADGSRADIGSYGGEGGDQWDVDGDGTPDYFWPGEWEDAPNGFDAEDYDRDDLDPTVR